MARKFLPPLTEITDGQHGITTRTVGELHLYANGTSGNDANDGLTVGTPKETLQAVFDLVPDNVIHNTCVHIAGEFIDQGEAILSKRVTGKNERLLIDGGADLTIKPSDGGPFTADADSNSVEYIKVDAAGWTPDAYKGWWVEIPNGSGNVYCIQRNTASQIHVVRHLASAQPAAEFRIVRPSTRIGGNTGIRIWGMTGGGWCVPQRFYLDGTAYFAFYRSTCYIAFSHLISTATHGFGTVVFKHVNNGSALDRFINPTTWAQDGTSRIGLSSLTGAVTVMGCENISFGNGVLTELLYSNSGWGIRNGNRCDKVHIVNSIGRRELATDETISNWGDANYAKVLITNDGLLMENADATISEEVDFSDCVGHAIELRNAEITFIGAATGSSNAGLGIYAHSGSQVLLANGVVPTLTGDKGEIGVLNPDYEDAQWADIATDPLQIAAESTIVKEIA